MSAVPELKCLLFFPQHALCADQSWHAMWMALYGAAKGANALPF
jgi:hypothetical protein